jgi:hypothetical protein
MYSRRQYIFQFEKWGVQKYNKRCENGLADLAAHGRAFENSSSDIRDENVNYRKDSQHTSTPIGSKPSQSGRRPRPDVPPKKRQKLSNFTSEKVRDNAVMALEQISRLSPLTQTGQAGNPFPVRISRQPFSYERPEPGRASFFSAREEEKEDDSPGTGNYAGEDCRLLSSPEDPDLMDIDTDTSMISISQQEDPSTDEGPRERRLDVGRLIDSFAPDEIDEMKLAADFLFAAQCHEDSFALYVLLLKRLNDSPDHRDCMTTAAIIGCARSSATSSQAEISRNLLEQKLSARPDYSQDTVESFLFRSLLGDIYRKQGDDDAAQFHSRVAMQSSFAKRRSLMPLPQDNRTLDLVTYQYLNRGLTGRGHFLAARNVTNQLLQQEPGPFEYEEGHMRNLTIRSCLQWCVGKLKRDRMIIGSWRNLGSRDKNMRREDGLGLFCDLWQRWQRQLMESTGPVDSLAWAYQVEQAMGISPAELLMVTCQMLLNACPFRNTLEEIFNPLVYEADLARRALRGGNTLAESSDMDLAHAFLDAYSSLNRSTEGGFADSSPNSLARDYIRSFLQQSLQLELPEVCNSNEAELSQTIAKLNASQASLHNKSLLPTIATSLNSSDFNSFRSLKERINDHIEGAVSKVYCQLPSSAMRDASTSSLSLPPMIDMTQSALETLATVSNHVREQIADVGASAL